MLGEDNFELDLQDDRFSKLLSGDANFGIDPLSSDFKATPGMQKLMGEVGSQRVLKRKAQENQAPQNVTEVSEIDRLTQKLKNKFKK